MVRKNPTLFVLIGVLIIVIGATTLWATITETWSGDASGTVNGFTPFANWEGVIDEDNRVEYFYGTWQSGSVTGVFGGTRDSEGEVDDGIWNNDAETIGGTFEGTFVDTGGSALYDTVAGTWIVTYGGTGNGDWWGYRDSP